MPRCGATWVWESASGRRLGRTPENRRSEIGSHIQPHFQRSSTILALLPRIVLTIPAAFFQLSPALLLLREIQAAQQVSEARVGARRV